MLARKVAEQLMARDALGAHARDELGISGISTARPIQAALTSAATFSAGAATPLLAALVAPVGWIAPVVSIASLIFLSRCSARSGRRLAAPTCSAPRSGSRSGALAMAITAGIGALFGTVAA